MFGGSKKKFSSIKILILICKHQMSEMGLVFKWLMKQLVISGQFARDAHHRLVSVP